MKIKQSIKKQKRGFTLIELLVVVAIISLLSSIVLASLNGARVKARNVKRLQDIRQYSIAFELVLDKYGEYPDPGDAVSRYCLGDYSIDDKCWANGTSHNEINILNTILNSFLPGPPPGDSVYDNTGNFTEGYLYWCMVRTSAGLCTSIEVLWSMEGINQSCGVGVVRSPSSSGTTICQYNR